MTKRTKTAKAKGGNLKTRKFSQVLPCALDPKECASRGMELAKICQEIPLLEDEKTLKAKEFKERLDAMEAKRQELARQVRDAAEEKSVECEEVIDLEAATAKTIRLDTKEIIDGPRKLDETELQAELGLGGGEGQDNAPEEECL